MALPTKKSTCHDSDKKTFTVYILRTSSNTLYIGQTNNIERRLKEHKRKSTKSAKYMKYFHSFCLVYTEVYKTRQEAMRREWLLKQWTKAKKEALVQAYMDKTGVAFLLKMRIEGDV